MAEPQGVEQWYGDYYIGKISGSSFSNSIFICCSHFLQLDTAGSIFLW